MTRISTIGPRIADIMDIARQSTGRAPSDGGEGVTPRPLRTPAIASSDTRHLPTAVVAFARGAIEAVALSAFFFALFVWAIGLTGR